MKQEMIRHIIFDFDGTIADSMNLAVELYNRVADRYKFKIIREEEFAYLSNLSILEKCKYLNVSLVQIPRLGIELNKNYNKAVNSIQVCHGIKELIYELKQQNFKLSIISSNSNENIRKFLVKNNLDVFDGIYSAKNIFGKDKAINSFIRKQHLNKEEIIYIGDEYRDIVACKATNIKIISVTWGFDSFEMISSANPDYIVEKPADIMKILAKINIGS